tara:strand:- start:749 stop:1120 length:372 start_codon:yes stop_codon:yes gene_type:complete
MKFDELNKDNFLLFAIQNYINPTASTQDDFEEDLRRFKYVKRWLKRYHETGTINSHLLLNHIIIIFNCWGDAAVPMFFYKLDSTYWEYLKSFLIFLGRLPSYPPTELDCVSADINIISRLQNL